MGRDRKSGSRSLAVQDAPQDMPADPFLAAVGQSRPIVRERCHYHNKPTSLSLPAGSPRQLSHAADLPAPSDQPGYSLMLNPEGGSRASSSCLVLVSPLSSAGQ